jgi:hypothetical protein
MSLPSAVDSTSSSLCPSHFVLDQMAVGELDHDSQRALERHLASCAACHARLAERRAAEADFIVDLSTLRALQQPPASDASDVSDASSAAGAREAGVVSTRPTRSSPSSVGVVRWLSDRAPRVAVTLAAAAGLTLAFVSRDGDRIDGAADGAVLVGPAGTAVKEPSVRAKGSARSALFVKDARGVRGLFEDGDVGTATVFVGDTLQVAVTSTAEAFVAVLSLDPAGARSTYVASANGELLRVSPGRNVPLPQATILDDVVGQETVAVFVCREASIRVDALQPFIQAGEPPLGCGVDRYLLDKKAGR